MWSLVVDVHVSDASGNLPDATLLPPYAHPCAVLLLPTPFHTVHTHSHFQVWSLVVDVHVLDASGNLPDACCLSALGALMAFRKPEVTVGGASGSEVIIHPPEVKEPLPLTIHHLPVAISFGLFEASRREGGHSGKGRVLWCPCQQTIIIKVALFHCLSPIPQHNEDGNDQSSSGCLCCPCK